MSRQLVPVTLLARAAPPTQPAARVGDTYFDTVNKVTRTFDGTEWTLPQSYTFVEGGGARKEATVSTGPLASQASEALTVALGLSFRVLKLQTSRPARVRLYSSLDARDADRDRPVDVIPSGDHGLILDALTDTDSLALRLSPQVDGSSFDPVPSQDIPCIITNEDSSDGAVSVTFTFLRSERSGESPAGVSGGTAYKHNQASPASIWMVEHQLGFDPGGVLAHDLTGQPIGFPVVLYKDVGQSLWLSFDHPVAGTATLS